MKKIVFMTALLLVSFTATSGQAFTIDRGYGLNDKVIGGYWSNGLALVAGDGYEDWNGVDREYRTPLYSPGGYFYFDYYLLKILAIEGGFGFLNKGIRFSNGDNRLKERIVYMEIPVMAKIDIQHIQFGAGLALFVGLAGKTKIKGDTDLGNEFTSEVKWGPDEWDDVRRVNLGFRLYGGYAIEVGPVFIVPSITWMIHLINDLDNEEIADELNIPEPDYRMRATNLMFNVGVDWAF